MTERLLRVSIADEYRPGDPPPKGYLAWHEWARVQDKAGRRQAKCALCSLWRFPQELSARTVSSELTDRNGRAVSVKSPVCLECNTDE